MKNKTKIISVLTTLFMISLGVVVSPKQAAKTSAYIEANAHTVSSEYVRIVVAPDGDAKKDNWNKDGAITALVILEASGAPITKGGSLIYGNSGSRHLIEHDRQYRPSTGNYALGGSGATDYVANGNKGLKLWFFNVRYDLIAGKRFQIARMDPTITAGSYKAWNITEAQVFNDANITKVFKVELGGGDWATLNFSNSAGGTFSNVSVSYVLEGYMTCSPSSLNGYGAYAGLNATYGLDGRVANTTAMKDFDYATYEESSTYATGRPNDSGAELTTVGEKVTRMKALYEADSLGSGVVHNESGNNYVALTLILSLSLTGFTGWFLLSKKSKIVKN